MTPHRTPSPSPFDLAAVTRRGLPRDLKRLAANADDFDAAPFGPLPLLIRLGIGACTVFALIWIALAMPDDTPAAPAPANTRSTPQ